MANPWMKKNPFMSLWLSGANKVAGAARGQVAAQAKRNTNAAIKAASAEMVDLWAGALAPPSAAKRKKRRP